MKKKLGLLFVLIFMAIIIFNVAAAERTIPVDIFLMIDKSLSMEDPGKFDSLHKWVRDELIGQMLIHGDWITIYQFYERPEHVLTLTVENENSRQRIINTIDAIKPDGRYTDIGYALETIQEALDKRGSNGRYKILLLVTDLEQDAPWTSKYRGKQASFDSPYFAEARIIKRDNWFEITLDMDIQDTVIKRTQSLYSDVIANEGRPRSGDDQNKSLIEGETKVIDKTDKTEGSGNESNETDDITQLATSDSTEGFESSTGTDIKADTDDQNSQESEFKKNLAKGSNNENSKENFDNENLEKQNATKVNSEDENTMNESDNTLVFSDSNEEDSAANLNSKENKKTKKINSKGRSINQSTIFIILIAIAAIIFLILLILLIKYLKDKHNEKEAQKRPKKPLV